MFFSWKLNFIYRRFSSATLWRFFQYCPSGNTWRLIFLLSLKQLKPGLVKNVSINIKYAILQFVPSLKKGRMKNNHPTPLAREAIFAFFVYIGTQNKMKLFKIRFCWLEIIEKLSRLKEKKKSELWVIYNKTLIFQ